MSEFFFKRFSVRNELSAMKVNTDGVLLGTAMTIMPGCKRILEVGTGTGSVALIVAQRISALLSASHPVQELPSDNPQFQIVAIDIDNLSASEARDNFARSPWAGNLTSKPVSLQEFTAVNPQPLELDLIFSNPPYFEDSLKAPDRRRNTARHTDTLSYRDIIDFSALHLSPKGIVSMILPADMEKELVRYAVSCGLYPHRLVRIKTVQRKAPVRVIAEFSKTINHKQLHLPIEEMIVIHSDGQYTEQYKTLTRDFLLWS